MNYATCEGCEREMEPGAGCTWTHVIVDNEQNTTMRIVVGSACDMLPGEEICGDCNAGGGQPHHMSCDQERCPLCGQQALGCECLVAGEPGIVEYAKVG